MYENDHFNQAQAEFKKELNGQSKPVAQKKKKEKKEGVYHALREWLECMVHTLGPFESQHCPSFTIRCILSLELILNKGYFSSSMSRAFYRAISEQFANLMPREVVGNVTLVGPYKEMMTRKAPGVTPRTWIYLAVNDILLS